VRASNYRAEEVVEGGVTRDVPMPAVTTYKGSVEGVYGTDARFTLDGEHIEGMIITPQQSYFRRSAGKYSAAAGANDYLLYKASDVRPDVTEYADSGSRDQSRRKLHRAHDRLRHSRAQCVFTFQGGRDRDRSGL